MMQRRSLLALVVGASLAGIIVIWLPTPTPRPPSPPPATAAQSSPSPSPAATAAATTPPPPAAALPDPAANSTPAPLAERIEELDRQLTAHFVAKHDLSDPATRAAFLAEARRLQTAHDDLVREHARFLGLALEGDLPGGGRFALVGFEDDQPVYHRTENANAAISTAANAVRQTVPYSVDGSGVVVGLWEAGGNPRADHQEFRTGRITIVDTASVSSHATHVAGTLIATGLNASVKGMAPAAGIRAYSSYGDTTEMSAIGAVAPVDKGRINLSNHSYGLNRGWEEDTPGQWIWYGSYTDDPDLTNDTDTRFGRYHTDSATMDGVLYNLPYLLPFFSAGNHRNDGPPPAGATWYQGSTNGTQRTYNPAIHPRGDGVYKNGYDTLEGKKVSKNTLVVGAVLDAVSGGSRSLAAATSNSFSCFGPTDDGRIKPDIVANGNSLVSTVNSSTTATGSMSGTSMAAPNAAGSAALLVHYHAARFDNAAMRASLLKALVIHTADDLGVAGPDYTTGWGLMNTLAAAQVLKAHADATGRASLIDGALTEAEPVRSYSFFHDGVGPLRATLCWTDPAAGASASNDDRTAKLVNDLDLAVTAPDSSVLRPFVMPHVGSWSLASLSAAATHGVNHTDNVEQVYRASAAAGIHTVLVSRTGVLTHGEQTWSLIATGHAAGPLTPLEVWRYQNWQTLALTATTANTADPDADGLPNLVEYAFGFGPATPTPHGQLPAFTRDDDTITLVFETPAGVAGIAYAVETSIDLADWEPLPDIGSGATHHFTTTVAGIPRRFFRIVVSTQ